MPTNVNSQIHSRLHPLKYTTISEGHKRKCRSNETNTKKNNRRTQSRTSPQITTTYSQLRSTVNWPTASESGRRRNPKSEKRLNPKSSTICHSSLIIQTSFKPPEWCSNDSKWTEVEEEENPTLSKRPSGALREQGKTDADGASHNIKYFRYSSERVFKITHIYLIVTHQSSYFWKSSPRSQQKQELTRALEVS